MNTIKKGTDKVKDIMVLCKLLGIDVVNVFDDYIKDKVIEFQKQHSLDPDGIVGPKTWFELFIQDRLCNESSTEILESDYDWAGLYMDCEPAALKAVVEVETGGRDGFISPGKPIILFEGHIFWKQLKNEGIDPEPLQKTHPGIVYPKWTKEHYLGGAREYERFDEACSISRPAAINSTSFGIFQVMGFNYKVCSCNSIDDFYNKMCESEFRQFTLGLEFIRNSGLQKYLKNKDWAGFAKRYNGPGYAQNKYDTKLANAYNKYKK